MRRDVNIHVQVTLDISDAAAPDVRYIRALGYHHAWQSIRIDLIYQISL
jgi:hypothetical protein